MRASRLFRIAPLTCLFASSWACGLIGFALGLQVGEGVAGAVWGSLIGPAYQLVLVGALLGIPFPWRLLTCLGLLALADYGLHLLGAAGRHATALGAARLRAYRRASRRPEGAGAPVSQLPG